MLRARESKSSDEDIDFVCVEGGEICLEDTYEDGVGDHLSEDVGMDVLGGVLEGDDDGVLLVEGAGLLGEGFYFGGPDKWWLDKTGKLV